MYTKLPNSKIWLTKDETAIPSLEELGEMGSVINTVNKSLYYIEQENLVTEEALNYEAIAALLGVNRGLYGQLSVTDVEGVSYSVVQMNDIGTSIYAGDILNLPHGVTAQVLFIIDNDTLAIKGSIGSKYYKSAYVSRGTLHSSLLENPSELSELWDSIRPADSLSSSVRILLPLPEIITDVVILGGDIVASAASAAYIPLMENVIAVNGISDVTVTVAHQAAATVEAIHTSLWDGIKDSFTAKPGTVVILPDLLLQDAFTVQPFNTADTSAIDGIKASVRALMESIIANGNIPVVPDGVFTSWNTSTNTVYDNPEEGLRPFYDAITSPLVDELTPKAYDTSAKHPYLTLFDFTRNYHKLFNNTGTRLSVEGQACFRIALMERLVRFIKGIETPKLPELTSTEILANTGTPQDVFFLTPITGKEGTSNVVPNAMYLPQKWARTGKYVVAASGYLPNSLTYDRTETNFTIGTNPEGTYSPVTAIGPGSSSKVNGASMDNPQAGLRYLSNSVTEETEIFTLKGYAPNQSVEVTFLTRADVSTPHEVEFSINSTVKGIGDAANDSGKHLVTLSGNADSDGNLKLTTRLVSGTVSYLCALQVTMVD